jgi:transposase
VLRCILLTSDAATELTDDQCAVLQPVLGALPRRADERWRPWRDSRAVLNGILWILRTGAQWHTLPAAYPPYQTCHRRVQRWVCDGTLEGVLEALACDLKERGKLDLTGCFIDGTCFVAKKGGGADYAGEGTTRMAVADRAGLPLAAAAGAAAATPQQSTLVAATGDCRFLAERPRCVIGDRASDADPLDAAPSQRRGRTRPETQDGRPLRRDRRRRKSERLFAWLGNFRRLVVRCERHALTFLGLVHLGCALILLQHSV